MRIQPAIILICLLAHLLEPSAMAQGILLFHANLRPTPDTIVAAIPQNGEAWLSLEGNQLSGNFWVLTDSSPTAAQVIDLNRMAIFKTMSFVDPYPNSGLPGNIKEGVWGGITVTDTQGQELQNGQWSAVVSTLQFPAGEIMGQFQLVPEPSTWAMGIAGGFLIFVARRKS
jgi:hypothetical protein